MDLERDFESVKSHSNRSLRYTYLRDYVFPIFDNNIILDLQLICHLILYFTTKI